MLSGLVYITAEGIYPTETQIEKNVQKEINSNKGRTKLYEINKRKIFS